MKILIILGDMVEFLDGNSLRWKMLEMQMPWLDIDVRVIFKNEDVVDGSVVKLIISTIPKAYNRWPLKNDDFAESSPFGKGKIFRCLLTYSGVPQHLLVVLRFVHQVPFPPTHPAPGVVSPAGWAFWSVKWMSKT